MYIRMILYQSKLKNNLFQEDDDAADSEDEDDDAPFRYASFMVGISSFQSIEKNLT